jgi:hypothetical protein
MPYYFQQFNLPIAAPFESDANRWPTCVGEFIKPLVAKHPGLKYWFSFYRDYFQLCFYTDKYAEILPDIETTMTPFGITWKRKPEAEDTLEGDCARDKFYTLVTKDKRQRSLLVLDYFHAISALYIDQLIKRLDGKWEPEPNADLGNNCDGVIFQSLMHMLCNMTRVPTPVFSYSHADPTLIESSLTILNAGRQKIRRFDIHF